MVESQIIHGDTIDAMKSLPDSCADLIIADPPYDLEKDKEFGVDISFSNHDEWLQWSTIDPCIYN